MEREALEVAAASVASKTTYVTGAASAVLGFLGSNAFAVVFGAIVTLATFLVNLHYRRKADRRAEALNNARIESLRRTGHSDSDMAPLDGEDA